MIKNNRSLLLFSLSLITPTTDPEPPKPGVVQGKVADDFNKVLTNVQLNIQGNGITKWVCLPSIPTTTSSIFLIVDHLNCIS